MSDMIENEVAVTIGVEETVMEKKNSQVKRKSEAESPGKKMVKTDDVSKKIEGKPEPENDIPKTGGEPQPENGIPKLGGEPQPENGIPKLGGEPQPENGIPKTGGEPKPENDIPELETKGEESAKDKVVAAEEDANVEKKTEVEIQNPVEEVAPEAKDGEQEAKVDAANAEVTA